MLDWFRRMIPQSGDFFTLFERHSAACVAAAVALAKLTKGEGDPAKLCAEIHDREHEADEIIRHVLNEVRHTFLTPFDRGAIISLIGAMDDTIDEIHACASAIELAASCKPLRKSNASASAISATSNGKASSCTRPPQA